MSSPVSSTTQQTPNYVSLNDVQKKDVENIANAAAKQGATKNFKDFMAANKDLRSALKQAEKDGISKGDLKAFSSELRQSKVGKEIAARKAAGQPVDSKRNSAILLNDFQRYCKSKGMDVKKPESFDKFKADLTPNLKESGLGDDDINKLWQGVASLKDQPGVDLKKLVNSRV